MLFSVDSAWQFIDQKWSQNADEIQRLSVNDISNQKKPLDFSTYQFFVDRNKIESTIPKPIYGKEPMKDASMQRIQRMGMEIKKNRFEKKTAECRNFWFLPTISVLKQWKRSDFCVFNDFQKNGPIETLIEENSWVSFRGNGVWKSRKI